MTVRYSLPLIFCCCIGSLNLYAHMCNNSIKTIMRIFHAKL